MTAQQITAKIEALKVEKSRLIENCGDTTINQREIYRAQIREIEKQIDVLVTERLNAEDEPQTDAHGNALCERCHSAHIFYADSERFCQSCLLAIEIESNMSEQTTFTVGNKVRNDHTNSIGTINEIYPDGMMSVTMAFGNVLWNKHNCSVIDDNAVFTVGQTIENRYYGGIGTITEIHGEWHSVDFGNGSPVLLLAGDMKLVETPVNEDAASLKDFDAIDGRPEWMQSLCQPLSKPIGQVNMHLANERDAELETLRAEIAALKAERDAACKALLIISLAPEDEKGSLSNKLIDLAENGLIASNYYVRSIRSEAQ